MAASVKTSSQPSASRSLHGRLEEFRLAVEERLPALLPSPEQEPRRVHEAMHYALTSPGKRLRPVLTLAVAELFGARPKDHLDLGCTLEMVHASSLILDDLPSMDDASLRRGRPTTHRVFGEATALLASFGLLNRAFSLLADRGQRLQLRRYSTEDMVHHLADAIGSSGLIGGQALDLESRPQDLDLARLEFIHSHKTGALFLAAGELGAMAADARRRDLEMISRYAKNLGLAFQITDDLLDVLATPEETGKDSHQDDAKVTFVKLLGVAGARALAEELLAFAVASLEPLGKKAEPLRSIARFVESRSH
ncbi:MAG: polyprenyl synthetase family protein [Acidobacteria bacterium]|nr:polyprenyl synthetase family protein [Acidobacteriota bacterium]